VLTKDKVTQCVGKYSVCS